MTTAQGEIYEHLIQNGNTNAANAMSMATLGAWTTGRVINTGRNKLSVFIRRFPQLFVLIDNSRFIYARTPLNLQDDDDDITQEEGSLLSNSVPYSWDRRNFQGTYVSPPFHPDVNVALVRPPRPPPPTESEYSKSMDSPLFTRTYGGKRKSRSRSRSRTARKSRSRRNRNRRTKTARKY
jgi:hypothetical protein